MTHWPGSTEKQPSKCDYYAQQIGRPEQEQIEVVVRITVVRGKPAAQHQQTQEPLNKAVTTPTTPSKRKLSPAALRLMRACVAK